MPILRAARKWGPFVFILSRDFGCSIYFYEEQAFASQKLLCEICVVYAFLSKIARLDPFRYCKAESRRADTETALATEAAWNVEASRHRKATYCSSFTDYFSPEPLIPNYH